MLWGWNDAFYDGALPPNPRQQAGAARAGRVGWVAVLAPRAARHGLRSARSHALLVAMAGALLMLSATATASFARRVLGFQTWGPQGMPSYSATLEQCLSSAGAMERSVTFTGEMVATPGTLRMGMRIELQQRTPGQSMFHTVLAPGLGVWRGSEAGVKIYRYVRQITNLSAPAMYRAVVHFRWVGDRGRTLRRAQLITARCVQPSPAVTPPAGSPPAGSPASAGAG